MGKNEQNQVLFICSGNFYRSRFAEAVFNHVAHEAGLGWTAISRGFRPTANPGDLSPHAARGMKARGIARDRTSDVARLLVEKDFEQSKVRVALREIEHRPMLAQVFPEWADKVEYWDIEDDYDRPPEHAMAEMEAKVRELVELLRALDRGTSRCACHSERSEESTVAARDGDPSLRSG